MRDTIWRAAQERLRGELPEKDYETWIAPLRAAPRWRSLPPRKGSSCTYAAVGRPWRWAT